MTTAKQPHRLLPVEPTTVVDSLEDAAIDVITRVPRPARSHQLFPRPLFNDDQAAVLARRLGLDGQPGSTLQEAGDLVGISRERVRQLEEKLDEWLTATGPQPDDLVPEVMLRAVGEALRDPSDDLGARLRRSGLTRHSWTLERLVDLVHLCGRTDLDDVLEAVTSKRVAESLVESNAVRCVWEASGKSGFATIEAVRPILRERLDEIEPGAIAAITSTDIDRVLVSSDGVLALPNGYLFAAAHRDPTVVETTRRMLQLTEPLALRAVRSGLQRRCRFRQVPFKVPLTSLRAFYQQHPDFDIDDGDWVSCRRPTEDDDETLQKWIVAEIRASDYGLLTRNQILQRARTQRLNASSVQMYLTYGELIAHDRRGFFYPVGQPPPEAVVGIAMDVAEATVRETTQSWRFMPDRNRVEVLLELGDSALSSGVIFADSPSLGYLDLLGDTHYAILDELDVQHGNLRVSEPMHALVGLSTLFAHTFPESGDLLRLTIDLTESVALAEVGGSELDDQ
jgi:hypothetical protein